MAKKLHGLAELFDLGKHTEMKGRALRFDALYKASQLVAPPPRGPRVNGQTDPLSDFSPNSRKVITMLRPLEPESYQRLRNEAIENGTLSEKSFKAPATPKQSSVEHLNPRRFMYDLLADMRTNLKLSYQLEQVDDWANDPVILENLGPIVEQFVEFAIALGGRVRHKTLMEKKELFP
jgi:hypothetical protein